MLPVSGVSGATLMHREASHEGHAAAFVRRALAGKSESGMFWAEEISGFCKSQFLHLKNVICRGTWMAQSVERPTSAQVMISQFVGLSPTSGSVPTAQSLEPASDSVSPSLTAPLLLMLCLSDSQKLNKCLKSIFLRKRRLS